jgi:hypothetical protein
VLKKGDVMKGRRIVGAAIGDCVDIAQAEFHPETKDPSAHGTSGVPVRTDLGLHQHASAAECERLLTKPVDPATVLRLVAEDVSGAERVEQAGLTMAQAEDLLDWLDTNGYSPAGVTCREGKGFTVRCLSSRDRD